MAPPNLSVGLIARSKLTALPSARPPRALRRSVSGIALKTSVSPSRSFTVRHTPFTDTLSPTRVPSTVRFAERLRRNISPASSPETRPTSSTSPVNTVLLAGRVQRHGDVFAYRLHARDGELEGLGHLRDAQGPDHGHASGADELGRVEQGELVGEVSLHEAGGGLPTPLDEDAPNPPQPQLVEDEAEIQALRTTRRAHDIDAQSLELAFA